MVEMKRCDLPNDRDRDVEHTADCDHILMISEVFVCYDYSIPGSKPTTWV